MLTKILRLLIGPRVRAIYRSHEQAKKTQKSFLIEQIKISKNTLFGRKYNFKEINDFDSFRKNVPLFEYDNLYPFIEKIKNGEKNILTPYPLVGFAKSSGTTARSKYIPLTKKSLKKNHFASGMDMLALYLTQNKKSALFSGKVITVSGSIQEQTPAGPCGDVSVFLRFKLPLWAKAFRSPRGSVAKLPDWHTKVAKVAHEAKSERIVGLAGVPTWTLHILESVVEKTGMRINDVWPNLEVFFYGGVSLAPYKELFKKITAPLSLNYIAVYNASEGFFAVQDRLGDDIDDMLLLINREIFYEFIPLKELGKESPKTLLLDEVIVGEQYALVVTTSGGLFRYMIGDTIIFTSKKPYRIQITGRTKQFINVFGEELMVHNAENAIAEISQKHSVTVLDYTAGPVYMEESSMSGCHEWYMEFDTPPTDIEVFRDDLDKKLRELNADYDAKRNGDMALQKLKLEVLPRKTFERWLEQKGKIGSQHKVPRLSNNRQYIDELKKFLES